jgi:hypothetical protein
MHIEQFTYFNFNHSNIRNQAAIKEAKMKHVSDHELLIKIGLGLRLRLDMVFKRSFKSRDGIQIDYGIYFS